MYKQDLYGACLKSSNERLLIKYGGLAKFIVGKYKKAFRLSDEQADDLEHSLLITIFRAPKRYRNGAGVSIIFKTQVQTLIRKTIKHEPEICMGLPRPDEGLNLIDPPAPSPDHSRAIDFGKLFANFDDLTSTERTVLGMTYGVDDLAEFPDAQIARRLGKSRRWVQRTRNKAILRLRRVLKIPESMAAL